MLISSKLVARVTPENQMTSFDCPSKSFLHTSQLIMKHQTNIRWLFPLRKDILYCIEAINLSPVSLFVKPFCLFRLFTTVYTQPRLSRWYIAFCNADSNHFLDFCITAKVVKIISNISAQLVSNTRPLVEFFHCPILFDSVMTKLGKRSGRVRLPNRMNFWKKSKRPSTPPSFLENYIANFL